MEYKQADKLTNAELREYAVALQTEYEVVKKEISEKIKELDKMDSEWIKVQREIDKRTKPIL